MGMRRRILSLSGLIFLIACYTSPDKTMSSEAYNQVYATGPSRGGSTANAGDAVTGVLAAALTSIDRARSAGERKQYCTNLLRLLDNHNAPAYEWQKYYNRCP